MLMDPHSKCTVNKLRVVITARAFMPASRRNKQRLVYLLSEVLDYNLVFIHHSPPEEHTNHTAEYKQA